MTKCVLCNYPKRAAIEQKIAARQLSMTAAANVVGCNKASISRHMSRHVSVKILKAANVIEAREGIDVLKQVMDSHKIVWNVIVNAYKDGDMRTVLAGIDTETRQLKLAALVSGQLDESPRVNVLISPEYLELKAIINTTLAPYPDLRQKLGDAFSRVANGG